ncbi:hypothetical protein [Glaciimonas immobilis]|uniref:Uncharacterized protein n=1 Tax=Glaciimonas immobilis TaxID=728004 RepID=A0A840RM20_9BURK|nr:hypothetical protein [Glaciimonas immobilis]KAF3997979.1 hypothetical protein HAV38_10460 [Glaciimonas immobilis]MBB5199347.1 hypothetical protein [Glaciimonas immobilis]
MQWPDLKLLPSAWRQLEAEIDSTKNTQSDQVLEKIELATFTQRVKDTLTLRQTTLFKKNKAIERRQEKQLDIAINQIDQKNKKYILTDIEFSLRNGTILKNETPEHSGILLAPHVIAELGVLPLIPYFTLIDSQNRSWHFKPESAGESDIELHDESPTPGEIIIKLPRPQTAHMAEMIRPNAALAEEAISGTLPLAYGPYFVCLAPAPGSSETWQEIPLPKPSRFGTPEKLFEALSTGLTLFSNSKNLSVNINADVLRKLTYSTFAAKTDTLEMVAARHEEEVRYLEADAILWHGLNANPATGGKSFKLLDTAYTKVLSKLPNEEHRRARLLTQDKYHGCSVNKKLAELVRTSSTGPSSSHPVRLNPVLDRILSRHLKELLNLLKAGHLSSEELTKSLTEGGIESLKSTLDLVSCSLALSTLRIQIRKQIFPIPVSSASTDLVPNTATAVDGTMEMKSQRQSESQRGQLWNKFFSKKGTKK